jgi:hypothetical protein
LHKNGRDGRVRHPPGGGWQTRAAPSRAGPPRCSADFSSEFATSPPTGTGCHPVFVQSQPGGEKESRCPRGRPGPAPTAPPRPPGRRSRGPAGHSRARPGGRRASPAPRSRQATWREHARQATIRWDSTSRGRNGAARPSPPRCGRDRNGEVSHGESSSLAPRQPATEGSAGREGPRSSRPRARPASPADNDPPTGAEGGCPSFQARGEGSREVLTGPRRLAVAATGRECHARAPPKPTWQSFF